MALSTLNYAGTIQITNEFHYKCLFAPTIVITWLCDTIISCVSSCNVSLLSDNSEAMEDIALIDAVHMREASEHSERVRRALNTTESPELLRILIDYYFTKGSRGALKILTTLKSSHAQVKTIFLHLCGEIHSWEL